MIDDETKQAVFETAYCARIAQGLLEYELDPRNFTREMRARNALTWRGVRQALPVDKPSQNNGSMR
jgi:hypothetical protein